MFCLFYYYWFYLELILNSFYYGLSTGIYQISDLGPLKISIIAIGAITVAAFTIGRKNKENQFNLRLKPIPGEQKIKEIDFQDKAIPESLRFEKISLQGVGKENINQVIECIENLDRAFNDLIPEKVKKETELLEARLFVSRLSYRKRAYFTFLRCVCFLSLWENSLKGMELEKFHMFTKSGFFFFKTNFEKWKGILSEHKENLPFFSDISETSFNKNQRKLLMRTLSFNLYQISEDIKRKLVININGKILSVEQKKTELARVLMDENQRKKLIDLIDSSLLREEFKGYQELSLFLQNVKNQVLIGQEENFFHEIATVCCLISILEELEALPGIDLEKKAVLCSLMHQGVYADAQIALYKQTNASYKNTSLPPSIVTSDFKVTQTFSTDIQCMNLSEKEWLSEEERKHIREVILKGKDSRFPTEDGKDAMINKIGNYGTYEVSIQTDLLEKSLTVFYKQTQENPYFEQILP